MIHNFPTRIVLAALAFGAVISAPAFGATATTPMQVTATIPTACLATTPTQMAFGALTVSAGSVAASSATGVLNINCTSGGTYTIYVDAGSHPTGSQLRMQHSTVSTSFLNYGIYTDAGHGTVFPISTGILVTGTGNGSIQAISVFGALSGQSFTSAGAYADSLTFTFSY